MPDVPTLIAQLKAALERQDRAAINTACRGLVAARAPLRGQWRSIIFVLLRNGELTLARAAADILAAETGNSALGRFEQAATYARTGLLAEAQAIMASLPDDVPDPVGNAYISGTLATNLGQFDAAKRHLRRAVATSPGSGQAWLSLAMAGRVEDADRTAMLEARHAMAGAAPIERGAYHYAVGKALDEVGDHDAAFAAFFEGAAAVRATRPPAEATERAATAAAIDGWTGESLDALATPGTRSVRPIIVSGLPRSGTTLVEQILVSHSAVQGGEELGRLAVLGREIGGVGYDAVRQALARGQGDALVALYDHLIDERFPGSGRIVDKTLQISRFMGLVATLLPDVPVVWLRRDPLDTAWSIFRTYFIEDLAWTFDLAAIGRQMADEDRLFAHWMQLRPEQILPVHYADLVSDPDTEVRRIVAHCGLDLEPQQLRPHESARAVTTASVAQVRQPISRDAIGAAEPYRAHLQPFIDAYRAAGGTID
ncbi:sulfotransferase [Sphingomonas donggukensis]|uniref:Sulfotransferase n=1 Tax=Sphingomonas donggukensis TaxID=2949093 RepID=A0ABY4TSI3_9SPHN|nr:sulfotransferase family protein [Sphingomonas donggukensis]URW75356.1 sulfotransferase [Sphingomonas donggukensis]